MVLLISVSAICQTNSTTLTNDEPPAIDLTRILGKEVVLNGRVVLVNGKQFILTDEMTFARLEKAVKELLPARDYIKKLEAEGKLTEALLAKDAEVLKKANELDAARTETILALRDALKASKTVEDSERKAKEIAVKEVESLRTKVAFYRKWAFYATGAAVVLAWIATK